MHYEYPEPLCTQNGQKVETLLAFNGSRFGYVEEGTGPLSKQEMVANDVTTVNMLRYTKPLYMGYLH